MTTIGTRLRLAGAALGCTALLGAGFGFVAGSAGAATPTSEPAETSTTAPTTTAPPTPMPPDEPVCPAATANGRFVRYVYQAILERCPDESGATYWTEQLDEGMDPAVFADRIDMSDENIVDNNVVTSYQRALHRDPNAAELAAGSASIRSTHGDAALLSMLFGSDEFYSHLPPGPDTPEAWLGVVYNAVLERNPDSGGAAFFLAQLGDSPTAAQRASVVMTLEHSSENAGDWSASAIGAAFRRAPDPAGIGFWAGWLMGPGHWQTFRMWTMMLGSPEGYAFAQTQPNPAPPHEGS